MKFKQFLALVTDPDGFIALPHFQWTIQTNQRPTAREEAIAAKILQEANPRQNISSYAGWGPEQQSVLQQLWIHPEKILIQWRNVPDKDLQNLYSTENTESGPLPVPNVIKEPEIVRGNFREKIKEILGGGY